MTKPKPIEYENAPDAVRAVFDDIKQTRGVHDVNNFWKYIANDEKTLVRTWSSLKEIMGEGALDSVVKEMIYVAVSVTNNCGYCIASHTASASKAGMTAAQFGDLLAVVGMANETNRLANGYQVPIDPSLEQCDFAQGLLSPAIVRVMLQIRMTQNDRASPVAIHVAIASNCNATAIRKGFTGDSIRRQRIHQYQVWFVQSLLKFLGINDLISGGGNRDLALIVNLRRLPSENRSILRVRLSQGEKIGSI